MSTIPLENHLCKEYDFYINSHNNSTFITRYEQVYQETLSDILRGSARTDVLDDIGYISPSLLFLGEIDRKYIS